LPEMDIPLIGIDPVISREWLMYACAAAAIFGHCYPVWFQFAGGKGAATTLGVLGAVAPLLLVPAAAAWFATLLLTGYVGLATIIAGISVPVFVAATAGLAASNLLVFTSFVALFVLFTHRSNVVQLIRGQRAPDVSFALLKRSGRE